MIIRDSPPEGCPIMESMGKKPRRRRSFTSEFKAEIVELCQRGDRSVGQSLTNTPESGG